MKELTQQLSKIIAIRAWIINLIQHFMPPAVVSEPKPIKQSKQKTKVNHHFEKWSNQQLITFGACIVDSMMQNQLFEEEQLLLLHLHSKIRALMISVHSEKLNDDPFSVKVNRKQLIIHIQRLADVVNNKAMLSENGEMIIRSSGFLNVK